MTQPIHTATGQPRDDGGRFDSYERPASLPVHTGQMASFAFPPSFDTAEEHMQFYMTAPISDRILSNARFAYEDFRELQIERYRNQKVRELNEAQRKGEKWAVDLVEDVRQRYPHASVASRQINIMNRFEAEAEAMHPMKIHHRIVETLVRASWAHRQSGGMRDEEVLKIENYVVDAGSSERQNSSTVIDLAHRWQSWEWIDAAITESDLRVARTQERIHIHLARNLQAPD